jgi:hypothetical protein
MKKILTLLTVAALLISALCVFTVSADDEYTVAASVQNGLEAEAATTTNAPLLFNGGSVAADAARPATCSYLIEVTHSGSVFKTYTAYVNGTENASIVSTTYNEGNNRSTVFITLPEGTYAEVVVKAVDASGYQVDALKFTNITVTAAENTVSDEGWEVDYNPCWTLTAENLANGSSLHGTSITLNDDGYVTYNATSAGDPYAYYLTGSETMTGRYLLIKYNNHTIIPRMQLYMAQSAGIASDANMIEFEIAANMSGWTYVIVDLSENSFYNKDTQTLYNFRLDPLEARNLNGAPYTFTGEETIDVAYIKGFTTLAGVQGYLAQNELHTVTKTATLQESQLTAIDGGYTYTDKDGNVYVVTANGDGTYSYTFQAEDVRVPVKSAPTLLLDGSKLIGSTAHNATITKDDTTGIATLTATAGDAFYTLFSEAKTANRYMAVRYKTSVSDQMEFFLSSTSTGAEAGQSFKTTLVGDGSWHTAVIDLANVGVSSLNTETWLINFIRFDFFDASADGTMEVEYIAFFDSEDAAYQYNHEYKTYTVTFMANNQVVAKVNFEPGATSITEPEVPAKEGYTGEWASYTMADKNFTVKATYTAVETPTETPTTPTETPTEVPTKEPTETPTDPTVETDSEPVGTLPGDVTVSETVTEPATGASTVAATEGATTADSGDTSTGCSSVLGGAVAVLAVAAVAGVALKKKED